MLVYQRVKQIDGKPLAIKWKERVNSAGFYIDISKIDGTEWSGFPSVNQHVSTLQCPMKMIKSPKS